jgi:hypothetical protein
MLGEQFAELNGKIIGQRVLDIEGPTIETSVAASGSYKGTQVKETITFVGRPTSTGVLHGEGRGVIMAEGVSEMATYTGEGVGRINSSGSINWRGSVFYRTSSSGKLAFLDNLVGVFEVVIDAEGNFSEKDWEWK